RIAVPKLSERIEAGEIAPAIWLGTASVTAGMLNAASMGT
ncbi:MAG: putative rane protein, partial [Hyphomicrobiales bacterium]|nr:putative rane protein [Hyphomicrobiales bacterium]